MRKRYEAFDGTLFDTIQECEEYEDLKRVNTLEKDGNLRGWSAYLRPIATKQLIEDPGLADHLFIGSQLAFDAVTKYIEIDADEGTFGFFTWDEDLQCYEPVEEFLLSIQNQIADLQAQREVINELKTLI